MKMKVEIEVDGEDVCVFGTYEPPQKEQCGLQVESPATRGTFDVHAMICNGDRLDVTSLSPNQLAEIEELVLEEIQG